MTQKSLSPQMTSRISSPSGSTIIVVYRRRVWSVIRLRADADTSRMPVVWARTETDMTALPRTPTRRRDQRHDAAYCTSHESRRGHETVEARLEAVLAKRLGDPCVVDGSVGVDPVALRIHSKSEDFGKVRTFEQDLLPRDEPRQQIELHLVQLKQLGVVPAIERRIRQQQLRRAALDDRSAAGRPRRSPRPSAWPGSSRRCACARSSGPPGRRRAASDAG